MSNHLESVSTIICSYNVLSQGLVSREHFPWCTDKSTLRWKGRATLFEKQIHEINADIYCMQEVDSTMIDQFWRPTFESLGYEVFFSSKRKKAKHGLLTVYRKSKYLLLTQHTVNFEDMKHIATNLQDHYHLKKENIGQVTALVPLAALEALGKQDLTSDAEHVTPHQLPVLVVLNNHLYWKYYHNYTKLRQLSIFRYASTAVSSSLPNYLEVHDPKQLLECLTSYQELHRDPKHALEVYAQRIADERIASGVVEEEKPVEKHDKRRAPPPPPLPPSSPMTMPYSDLLRQLLETKCCTFVHQVTPPFQHLSAISKTDPAFVATGTAKDSPVLTIVPQLVSTGDFNLTSKTVCLSYHQAGALPAVLPAYDNHRKQSELVHRYRFMSQQYPKLNNTSDINYNVMDNQTSAEPSSRPRTTKLLGCGDTDAAHDELDECGLSAKTDTPVSPPSKDLSFPSPLESTHERHLVSGFINDNNEFEIVFQSHGYSQLYDELFQQKKEKEERDRIAREELARKKEEERLLRRQQYQHLAEANKKKKQGKQQPQQQQEQQQQEQQENQTSQEDKPQGNDSPAADSPSQSPVTPTPSDTAADHSPTPSVAPTQQSESDSSTPSHPATSLQALELTTGQSTDDSRHITRMDIVNILETGAMVNLSRKNGKSSRQKNFKTVVFPLDEQDNSSAPSADNASNEASGHTTTGTATVPTPSAEHTSSVHPLTSPASMTRSPPSLQRASSVALPRRLTQGMRYYHDVISQLPAPQREEFVMEIHEILRYNAISSPYSAIATPLHTLLYLLSTHLLSFINYEMVNKSGDKYITELVEFINDDYNRDANPQDIHQQLTTTVCLSYSGATIKTFRLRDRTTCKYKIDEIMTALNDNYLLYKTFSDFGEDYANSMDNNVALAVREWFERNFGCLENYLISGEVNLEHYRDVIGERFSMEQHLPTEHDEDYDDLRQSMNYSGLRDSFFIPTLKTLEEKLELFYHLLLWMVEAFSFLGLYHGVHAKSTKYPWLSGTKSQQHIPVNTNLLIMGGIDVSATLAKMVGGGSSSLSNDQHFVEGLQTFSNQCHEKIGWFTQYFGFQLKNDQLFPTSADHFEEHYCIKPRLLSPLPQIDSSNSNAVDADDDAAADASANLPSTIIPKQSSKFRHTHYSTETAIPQYNAFHMMTSLLQKMYSIALVTTGIVLDGHSYDGGDPSDTHDHQPEFPIACAVQPPLPIYHAVHREAGSGTDNAIVSQYPWQALLSCIDSPQVEFSSLVKICTSLLSEFWVGSAKPTQCMLFDLDKSILQGKSRLYTRINPLITTLGDAAVQRLSDLVILTLDTTQAANGAPSTSLSPSNPSLPIHPFPRLISTYSNYPFLPRHPSDANTTLPQGKGTLTTSLAEASLAGHGKPHQLFSTAVMTALNDLLTPLQTSCQFCSSWRYSLCAAQGLPFHEIQQPPLSNPYSDQICTCQSIDRGLIVSNHSAKWSGVLDHILIQAPSHEQQSHLTTTAIRVVEPLSFIESETSLPNKSFPSDHIPLAAQLEFH